jgi:hypothetical protein
MKHSETILCIQWYTVRSDYEVSWVIKDSFVLVERRDFFVGHQVPQDDSLVSTYLNHILGLSTD